MIVDFFANANRTTVAKLILPAHCVFFFAFSVNLPRNETRHIRSRLLFEHFAAGADNCQRLDISQVAGIFESGKAWAQPGSVETHLRSAIAAVACEPGKGHAGQFRQSFDLSGVKGRPARQVVRIAAVVAGIEGGIDVDPRYNPVETLLVEFDFFVPLSNRLDEFAFVRAPSVGLLRLVRTGADGLDVFLSPQFIV